MKNGKLLTVILSMLVFVLAACSSDNGSSESNSSSNK